MSEYRKEPPGGSDRFAVCLLGENGGYAIAEKLDIDETLLPWAVARFTIRESGLTLTDATRRADELNRSVSTLHGDCMDQSATV